MTKIKRIKCNTIDEIKNRCINPDSPFVFRGMANSQWKIKTSINRTLDKVCQDNKNNSANTNQNIFAEFKAQQIFIRNHSFELKRLFKKSHNDVIKIDRDNFLELQIILQHYQFPTRLSDWTNCWRIALYFCLEDTNEENDCALWMIKKEKIRTIENCFKGNYFREKLCEKYNIINIYYNRLEAGIYLLDKPFFKRIVAQKGISLVTGRSDYKNFEDHIEADVSLQKDDVIQLVISKKLRNDIKKYLETHGINQKNLYPNDLNRSSISIQKEEIESFINVLYPSDSGDDSASVTI